LCEVWEVVDQDVGVPESLQEETPEIILGHYWVFRLPQGLAFPEQGRKNPSGGKNLIRAPDVGAPRSVRKSADRFG
jgi:hypothetical protein